MFKYSPVDTDNMNNIKRYHFAYSKKSTVRKLIKKIAKLHKNTWGDIIIKSKKTVIASSSYIFGKILPNLPWKILNKRIKNIETNDCYSYITYVLIVND